MKKTEEKNNTTVRSDAKGNTTDQKQGPVNPTNPNALENQPGGNGNARSLLHDETNTERDSNAAGGTKTVEEQSQTEESLSSSSEAIKSAEANS